MDTNILIPMVIGIMTGLMGLLGSRLENTETDIGSPASTTAKRSIIFARPRWVRLVSFVAICYLLYLLNSAYSVEQPATNRTVFYIAMLFALLTLNVFSWILFEVSRKASTWLEAALSSSTKSTRSEKDATIKNLRQDLYADMKRSSETLDKVIAVVRVLRQRARRQLLDDEMDKLPHI